MEELARHLHMYPVHVRRRTAAKDPESGLRGT